jgi:hypothetical protein
VAAGPACRIDGIIATEANHAVIFRRGPSRLCQLLLWDLNSDVVLPGQWLQGRVYTKRCDVSPDGRRLIIAAANYARSHRGRNKLPLPDIGLSDGWTAVSRPPHFTALAIWFTGCAWNGGGIWVGNDELWVNRCRVDWHESRSPSPGLTVRELGLPQSEDEPLFSIRLMQRGWRLYPEAVRWTNQNSESICDRKATIGGPLRRIEEVKARIRDLANVLAKAKEGRAAFLRNRSGVGF